MDEKRFVKTYSQGGFVSNCLEIWVDKVTGVNYLYCQCGNAAGLTVMLNADGKPVITPPSQLREE